MQYFPVFMNLKDQPVLLVGAGSVAERKARLLMKAGANVRVIARHLNRQFCAWHQSGELEFLDPEYHQRWLPGHFLVFAATSDSKLNHRVFADAERERIAANVVDDTPNCRFISPAIVDRSPVQIAISTGGASPVLARRLRGWIERLLPLGLGRIAEVAGSMRVTVKKTLPMSQRRSFWESLLSDERLRKWSLQTPQRVRHQIQSQLNDWAAQQTIHARVRNGLERPNDLSANKPDQRNQDQHRSVRQDPGQDSEDRLISGDNPATGQVVLVGAGPGRADLLTLRALQVLSRADVILHDNLVTEDVLDLARRDADRIYVGKRSGHHHHTQDQIHDLMRKEAEKGRLVVRLKGGDAFIFGRGGEEISYLREHGIEFEVVPGITAAIGCAAFAGIPLTHRDHAQSVSFVTGHYSGRVPVSTCAPNNRPGAVGSTPTALPGAGQRPLIDETDGVQSSSQAGGPDDGHSQIHPSPDEPKQAGPRRADQRQVDWHQIAGVGRTVVVYMGVKQAVKLKNDILASGIESSLPVALIVDGTRATQKVLHGTLADLPTLAGRVTKGAPGLLIIGQVAALGANLGWFMAEPSMRSAA